MKKAGKHKETIKFKPHRFDIAIAQHHEPKDVFFSKKIFLTSLLTMFFIALAISFVQMPFLSKNSSSELPAPSLSQSTNFNPQPLIFSVLALTIVGCLIILFIIIKMKRDKKSLKR